MKKSRLKELVLEAYLEVLKEGEGDDHHYIKVPRREYKKAMSILDGASDGNFVKMDFVDNDGAGNVIIYFKFSDGYIASGQADAYMYDAVRDLQSQDVTVSDHSAELDEARDINDPALVRYRAAKMKKPSANPDYNSIKNARKIKALKNKRAEIMRDMEQEAEPEGGPIADKYGDMLNKIDAAISKLSEGHNDHDGGQLFDYFTNKGYGITGRSADGRKPGFEGYQVTRGNDRYPQSVIFQYNKDTDEFTISRMSGYRIDQEEAIKAGMREAGRSGAAGMDSYMTDGNYTPVEISAEGLKDIVDHVMTGLDRESKAQTDFYKDRKGSSGTIDEKIIKESLYDLLHEDDDETDDYGRPYVDKKGSRTYVDPKDMTPAARAAKMIKEEDPTPEEDPNPDAGPETVLEDATDTILAKFPTVKAAIIKLQTEDFKEFVDSIDWISPRPTTFRVNLKNGQNYILKWTGKGFEAQIAGKRYDITKINDYQQALDKLNLLYKDGPMKGAGEEEGGDFGGDDAGSGGGGGGDFPGGDAAGGGGEDLGGDDAGADAGGEEGGGEDLSDEPIDFEAGEEG